jgi:hypothetical protein
MKTYLVRWKCDGEADEKIVGMIKARDLSDLWMSVDHVYNPHEMQYFIVKGEGGVLLSGVHDGELITTENFINQQVNNKHPGWQTFVELAGGERLFDAMYRKWHSLGPM